MQQQTQRRERFIIIIPIPAFPEGRLDKRGGYVYQPENKKADVKLVMIMQSE
jgi:hypothetical protein